MMKGRQKMLVLFIFLFSAVAGEYLFTLPRVMEAGSSTSFCLLLTDMNLEGFNPERGFTVTVRLKYMFDGFTGTISEVQRFEFGVVNTDGDFHRCQKVNTPTVAGRFSVIVNASITYNQDDGSPPVEVDIFGAEKFIEVNTADLITLVQTDKPIYKPGQTVKFRVMTMDYNLMSRIDGYEQITIETPNGLRVMQWDDVPSPNGLVSLEMPLSSDPVLGSWIIKVLYGGKETSQTFTVDEYVLPKFEVTVTPPKYLLPTTKDIHGFVCAKYTYGKAVKGQVKMNVCYKYPYSYYNRAERPCANVIAQLEKDGCYEFFIDAEDIQLGNRTYGSWGNLIINASVTEVETDIELFGYSEGPHLTFYPLNLRLEDDSDNYFKPGFPYNGRVVVTNPDGSPAPGEHIRVEGSSYDSKFLWANTFTTDENGIAHFVINEFEAGIGSLSLHADATESDWRYTSDERYFHTYTPRAYCRVTKWFSPSESYLYMPDVDHAVECNSELNIDVYYTAEVGADYRFMTIVKAGNKITHTEEKKIKAADSVYNIEIVGIDNNLVLQKELKPTPPPPLPTLPTVPLPELEYYGEEPEYVEEVIEEVIVPEVVQPLGSEGAPRKRRDSLARLIGYFKLTIPVTEDMSPSAKILVYYMRTDKEVVATSLEFDVKTCFRNKVTMSFDETTVTPGADVNLNLAASPMSTCFVGMVDKSVTLLAGNNQLTPSQVFEKVKQVSRPYHYISYWTEDREYCEKQTSPRGPEEYYYSYYSPDGVDAIEAFRDIEMWVETDALLETRPCTEQRMMYYTAQRGMPDDIGGRGELGQRGPMPVELQSNVEVEASGEYREPEPEPKVEIRTLFPETWLWDIVSLGHDISSDDAYEAGGGFEEVADISVANAPDFSDLPLPKEKVTRDYEPETVRSFFPETWLWDILNLGGDGTFTYKTQIPDTITEWIGNTVCTHGGDGVGVTEMTGVTAFQPFFVSFTLPYSAVRGETLPVIVTVFNYLTDCITLEVQLRETEGFELSGRSANSRQFCLCGGESESTKFLIIPTIIGEIDLEVIAVSIDDRGLCDNVVLDQEYIGVADGVQRQLLIEPEGVPRDQTKSSYICVSESEVLTEVIDMGLPSDIVLDSERATVSVVGDIMGPTLSNLKNLLRMPYGCGEQNMASWSPNIYVMQYLSNTDQLTEEIEAEAEGYMSVGYQRQMKYRHNDNSYSAWGENRHGNATGSLWLTAFVVKSMAQSSDFIHIDTDDIIRSARWLVSKQQDDGCFPQVGTVFSSYLKGGLEGGNPAGLTAFTLTALLQADLGDEFSQNITNGFQYCLDEVDISTTDTYTLTLMSYAYTMFDVEGPRRLELLGELDQRAVEKDKLKYWQRDDDDESDIDSYDYVWYRAPSAEVEMTAYVLQSMLAEGNEAIGKVQPIVQWITKQRNAYGGFSSTQDTVVALQALAEFGKLTYSGDRNTGVTIEVQNSAIDHVFSVNRRNSLVYQSIDVNPKQGPVEIRTTGEGCALIQVNLKYNIYEEEDNSPAFDVKVRVYQPRTRRGRSCAFRTLEVCASYLKGGVSNMAIVEVKMPTGWSPDSSSLDELLQSDRIQKFEVDKNFVELYFDEFSRNRVCVDFNVEQEIEMNPKPALVKVYDYYETRYSVTRNYSIDTTCGTKEEIARDNAGLDCLYMQCRNDIIPKAYEVTCPVCNDTVEEKELERIFCDADNVYKAVVRRKGKFSIKLKADLRVKGKIILDKFVNYNIHECECPKLTNGSETKAFIFARKEALGASVITLEEGDTIIPYDRKYEKAINQLSSKSDLCDKLKRLKRSGSSESEARLRRLRTKLGLL